MKISFNFKGQAYQQDSRHLQCKYTLIFIQEGYIQEGQPQFGQKIKKFIYMMTSLLLNKGLRLNSDSNLLIYKKECIRWVDEPGLRRFCNSDSEGLLRHQAIALKGKKVIL